MQTSQALGADHNFQRLVDCAAIQDCLARYARSTDRGDWQAVRDTYHHDAEDQHGEYRGNVDGLIEWLVRRFDGIDNSMHFLGNCLIEFASSDLAFVETYFCSRRLRQPASDEQAGLGPDDAICREAWGRYLDHFERRDGQWRVARRQVVIEAVYSSVASGGKRGWHSPNIWGSRDAFDPSRRSRDDLFARAAVATLRPS